MLLGSVFVTLSLFGIAATVVTVLRDGYRQVPFNPAR